MSLLYDYLMTKPKEELAKLLAKELRDNASLKNEVHRLEHVLFWTTALNNLEKPDATRN